MSNIKHIHFIGIGGIGMSGIAKIAKLQNFIVSGCDPSNNKNIQDLKQLGCTISTTHCSEICKQDNIDLIVYSSAITQDHPERIWAQQNAIPTINRAEMLAKIMKKKKSIGIAGSHGKTTTSSMLSHILLQENIDPTIIIGGNLTTIQSNAHYGTSNILIAETDESDRSLLQLPVNIAVLTNIDYEHPDQYTNIDDVASTFKTFLNNTSKQEKAIVYHDDPIIQNIIANNPAKFLSFGQSKNSNFYIHDILLQKSQSSFSLTDNKSSKTYTNIIVPTPGIHNILNATAAITTASYLNISIHNAIQHIATFQGVDRRFTYKGTTKSNIEIFDDYGHHPTEIAHTLHTATLRSKNNLVVVFQPQRYTRTKYLWKEFLNALANNEADHIIVTDIYPASEQPISNITSQQLVADLQQQAPHKNIYYISEKNDFELIDQKLKTILHNNDLLLFLGAGKVNQMISNYIP